MKIALRLWKEEAGFVLSAEAVLYATLLVIGLIAGLTSVRDAVVTELADVAQAIANLNQSYTIGGAIGHCGATGGSTFLDLVDFCDVNAAGATQSSKCVQICSNIVAGAFAGQDGN